MRNTYIVNERDDIKEKPSRACKCENRIIFFYRFIYKRRQNCDAVNNFRIILIRVSRANGGSIFHPHADLSGIPNYQRFIQNNLSFVSKKIYFRFFFFFLSKFSCNFFLFSIHTMHIFYTILKRKALK